MNLKKNNQLLQYLLLIVMSTTAAQAEDGTFIKAHEANEEILIHEVYYPFLTSFGYKNLSISASSDFPNGEQMLGFSLNFEKKLAYVGLRLSLESFAGSKECTNSTDTNCIATESELSRTGFLIPIYLYSSQASHFALGGGVYSGNYAITSGSSDSLSETIFKKSLKMNEFFIEYRYENFLCSFSAVKTSTAESMGTFYVALIGGL